MTEDEEILCASDEELKQKIKKIKDELALRSLLSSKQGKSERVVLTGDVWFHRKTGAAYTIRGLSKFSDDGHPDGEIIIEYESNPYDAHKYSTPLTRFLHKFTLLEDWKQMQESLNEKHNKPEG